MKTSQLIATLQSAALLYEQNGAKQKAELLRRFSEAIAPLAKANMSEVLSTLSCVQRVDNK